MPLLDLSLLKFPPSLLLSFWVFSISISLHRFHLLLNISMRKKVDIFTRQREIFISERDHKKKVMESSQKEEGLLPSEAETNKKCCSDCKTTITPLWRSGPSGPKSLCNACGIKYRKKRPTAAVEKSDGKKGKIGRTRNMKVNDEWKEEELIKPLGREVEVAEMDEDDSSSSSAVKKKKKKREWGEVEKAALLLMALSCGAVFA